MSMNEADTRYHLIDPLLRAKGYVSCDQVTLETILTPAPVEPLIEFAQKTRELRERARQEAAQRRVVGEG